MSPDKFIDRGKTTPESDRYVGKMMLTQNPEDLAIFFDNPDADIAGCIRLSKAQIILSWLFVILVFLRFLTKFYTICNLQSHIFFCQPFSIYCSL